jgi:hypothetical protein
MELGEAYSQEAANNGQLVEVKSATASPVQYQCEMGRRIVEEMSALWTTEMYPDDRHPLTISGVGER